MPPMILRKGDKLELRRVEGKKESYFFGTVVQVTEKLVTLNLGNYNDCFHRQDFGKTIFVVDRKEREE